MRFLLLVLASVVLRPAWALEMFEVPEGVVARSLSSELETTGPQPSDCREGLSELLFPQSQFCSGVQFREGEEEWKNANRLCTRDRDEVSFVFISDSQESDSEHGKTAALVSRLASENPQVRFVLNAGDLVQSGSPARWGSYRDVASRYASRCRWYLF